MSKKKVKLAIVGAGSRGLECYAQNARYSEYDIVVDDNLSVSLGETTGNSVTLTGAFSSTVGSSFNGLCS